VAHCVISPAVRDIAEITREAERTFRNLKGGVALTGQRKAFALGQIAKKLGTTKEEASSKIFAAGETINPFTRKSVRKELEASVGGKVKIPDTVVDEVITLRNTLEVGAVPPSSATLALKGETALAKVRRTLRESVDVEKDELIARAATTERRLDDAQLALELDKGVGTIAMDVTTLNHLTHLTTEETQQLLIKHYLTK